MRLLYSLIGKGLILGCLTAGLSIKAEDLSGCKVECHKERKHHAQNDLIPILRFGIIPRFSSDEGTFLLFGEYGRNENRVTASLGVPLCEGHLFKLGVDYLNEKLSYDLSKTHFNRWVTQYAAGIDYRIEMNLAGIRGLDFGFEWSYAPSSHVGYKWKKSSPPGTPHQFETKTSYLRHIDGSTAYALSGGLAVFPWYWSSIEIAAVYDHVKYHRKFRKNKTVEGMGAVLGWNQRLTPTISFFLQGEYRIPYSYYGGSLRWATPIFGADVIIGAFGGHTIGQHGLPNSTVAGIEIFWEFGVTNYSSTRSVGLCWDSPDHYHCERSFCGQDGSYLRWMAVPAVYKPQVLAIADELQSDVCNPCSKTKK